MKIGRNVIFKLAMVRMREMSGQQKWDIASDKASLVRELYQLGKKLNTSYESERIT